MNISQDFANKLKTWRKHSGLTQQDAAQRLSITRTYYNQLERGRAPGSAVLKAFEALAREGAQKCAFPVGKSEHDVAYGLLEPRARIPLISWAQAGDAVDFDEIIDWENLVDTDVRDERALAITIRGDSMEPHIREGDVVILLASQRPRSGDVVVARLKTGGVMCKIFHLTGSDGRVFRLSSYNPAYPPLDLKEEEFSWIYPVGEQKRYYRR